ncbi:SDR family NAD(P)-dependent oxidoreductase [Oceaniglobus ichthyenteri]|uniref:SDR family NAD(P)-dependent oxidoreductase n=1 Tax=Oceaniglobus ichthyenteri TaxID=2136177 RepID=UPI000D39731A|nr:SDR family oxidoreductase [Oceaniglobus ichthyenteri]
MKRLQDKIALITGGAAGIGLETARLFLEHGAKVALIDLKDDDLSAAADTLNAGDDVLCVAADVSSAEDSARYVKAVLDRFGQIDVFFNNAGIEGKVAPLVDQKIEDFDRVMSVNVRGAFLGLQHVMPAMIERKSGSIINMSSIAGLQGSANVAPYITSKHAIVGLTRAAAIEAAAANVRVNSVHPSPINTRMMRSLEEGFSPGHGDETQKQLAASIPLARYGESIDVANLVLFLASDESAFITGGQYPVDGGLAAG